MLVTDFGVHSEQFGALEGFDERDGVTDGGQQDVAAGLVGLGLNRETDVVALVCDVVTKQVESFAVALEGGANVFRGVVFCTFATAPHDEGLGAEFDAEFELAHCFAHGEATNPAVVGGEAAVFEYGGAEEVGGDHRHDEAGIAQCLLEAVDLLLAFGVC